MSAVEDFLYFILYIVRIIRQPKWGHLKELHKAIKFCEKALVATDPTASSFAPNVEVWPPHLNILEI